MEAKQRLLTDTQQTVETPHCLIFSAVFLKKCLKSTLAIEIHFYEKLIIHIFTIPIWVHFPLRSQPTHWVELCYPTSPKVTAEAGSTTWRSLECFHWLQCKPVHTSHRSSCWLISFPFEITLETLQTTSSRLLKIQVRGGETSLHDCFYVLFFVSKIMTEIWLLK